MILTRVKTHTGTEVVNHEGEYVTFPQLLDIVKADLLIRGKQGHLYSGNIGDVCEVLDKSVIFLGTNIVAVLNDKVTTIKANVYKANKKDGLFLKLDEFNALT